MRYKRLYKETNDQRNRTEYIYTWKQRKQWLTLFGGGCAPKSLQMVTAAMKLKDVCSLGEKL